MSAPSEDQAPNTEAVVALSAPRTHPVQTYTGTGNAALIAAESVAADQGLSGSFDDRRYRFIGICVVVAVIAGVAIWSALAPIASSAFAPGQVRVESKRQAVEHLEGGIVASLLVREGAKVERGQVVTTLDSTQAKSQLEIVRGLLFAATAREARLRAQRDGGDTIRFPAALSAQKDDRRVSEALDVQRQIFRTRRAAYENEVELYAQQAEQLESLLLGLAAQQETNQRLISSFEEELQSLRALNSRGFAEPDQRRAIERQLTDRQGELSDVSARIVSTRSELVAVKLQPIRIHRQMRREVATELDTVRDRIVELEERLQSLTDRVDRTVIRAPQSGTVVDLSVHTIGAVIQPGQMLMDIVPDDQPLIVEARVSPVDVDRVAVGQLADIQLSAFKSRETTRIRGQLVNLSADSIIDDADSEREPYYLAVIEISDEGLEQLRSKDLTLIAGMPASASIHTGERTLIEYVSDPLVNTLSRSFIED